MVGFFRDLWWALTSDEKHPPSVQAVASAQGGLPPRETLTVQEYAVLRPFYEAQKEHSKPKTWKELRTAGFTPIEKDALDLPSVCNLWNGAYADMPLDYEKAFASEGQEFE